MSSTKPKYVKLVEIALIKGLGSMEDEQLFSKLNFIKTKIQNWLTNHLDLFVHMFEQSIFSMDKFPSDDEAMHIGNLKNINMVWMLEVSSLGFEVDGRSCKLPFFTSFELWPFPFCFY